MGFIEYLKVIFLGFVEGITEWLPVSSTGHMILVDEFIKLNMSASFMEMFFVVIQFWRLSLCFGIRSSHLSLRVALKSNKIR